jgi:hypothetical protein
LPEIFEICSSFKELWYIRGPRNAGTSNIRREKIYTGNPKDSGILQKKLGAKIYQNMRQKALIKTNGADSAKKRKRAPG